MSYAVRNDGLGWRSVSSENDLIEGEYFSETQPEIFVVDQVNFQVTRAQGKAALIRAGLWQGVLDFVDAISDPVEKAIAEVALNDTTHWQRSSAFLNVSAEALGLTDDQLDQLFIDASKIEL